MTSVSVVSAAADRIQGLLQAEGSKSNLSPVWRDNADSLQEGLKNMSRTLKKVREEELTPSKDFIQKERKIIQVFYEIDDAIALAAATAGTLPSNPRVKSRSSSKSQSDKISKDDLQNLVGELKDLSTEIRINHKQPTREGIYEMSKHCRDSDAARQEDPSPSMKTKLQSAMLKENLPVVCIWGKSGMGKSTLAKKVYRDDQVREIFDVFAWVPINGTFQTRDILRRILAQLRPDRKADVWGMYEIELTQAIFNVWKEKNCLVVLEDVEKVSDWKGIRVALPIDHQSISKIVIITDSEVVAKEAASKDGVYHMKALTEAAECRQILEEDNADFNESDWNDIGGAICSLCAGSPLIALSLWKSLKTVDEAARAQLLNEYDCCPSKTENSGVELQVLRIGYRCLPHEKKPCFLYMGQFPENHKIPVETLHLLLAAEDLASPTETVTKSLETIYDFGLVEVQEDNVSKTKRYKSCRLHDKIRKLSIWQGVDEDFFENIEFGSGKRLQSSGYRLSLYLNNYNGESNLFAGQDMKKKIRCLLVFDADEPQQQKSTWPREITDLKEFIALRILYFDGVDFSVRKVPTGIGNLVLLRYLSFRGCFQLQTFPHIDVINLLCLETLDLRVTDCKMKIPDVLFKMKKLRHLYFPEQYQSEKENSKLSLSGLELLEALVNFDTGVCNVKDLSSLTSVRILTAKSEGNDGDLDEIVAYLHGNPVNLQQSSLNIRNFVWYTKDMAGVIKMLLKCKSLYGFGINGEMDQLPENIALYETISELVLDGLELEDDPMGVLGKIQNLRSLVLVNDACVGDQMTFPATPKFANLRFLKVKSLQYLEELKFEREAMPELLTLKIKNCRDLEKVSMPTDLSKRLEKNALKEKGGVYLVDPLPSLY